MMATNAILEPSAEGIIWFDFASIHVAPAAPKPVCALTNEDVEKVTEKSTVASRKSITEDESDAGRNPDLISTPAFLEIG